MLSLSLRTKILFSVGIACAICAAMAVQVAKHYNEKEFVDGLIRKSQIIHSRLESATRYIARQGGLKVVIDNTTAKYTSPDQLNEKDKLDILRQVPVFAAMSIGADEADKEQYGFRVFSLTPRNEKNQATNFEKDIFNKFLNDPELKEQISNDGKVLTVYRPVRLSAENGCLNCHGSPDQSPWKNGKDILGFPMENWSDGKLHGVFAISNNISEAHAAQAQTGKFSNTFWLTFCIGVGCMLGMIFSVLITWGPLQKLKKAALRLKNTGIVVNKASYDIHSTAQGFSQSSILQASSLEETVATMEELTSRILSNTEAANTAARLAKSTQEVAAKGETEIKALIDSIEFLAEDSNKIVEITSVIDDIAFQTNLLALNASVEAARAGDQGRGFAVVADAVRSLALRSADSAKDIAALINASVEKINRGSEQASRSEKVLHEIVSSAAQVATLSQEIAFASQEQSSGISQISRAMNDMDRGTQANAAASEKSVEASGDLACQSEELIENVKALELVIEGKISE